MSFNFLRYVDKGTSIRIVLDGGVDIVGNYAFTQEDGSDKYDHIYIYVDGKTKAEKFQLKDIIQVKIPGN